MLNINTLSEPTLLLDKGKCLANIEKMVAKTKANGINFRPHFKTHQSRKIGSWYKDFDVETITTSSVTMAHYFAEDWKDITIAFPINIHEYDAIDALASKTKINLVAVNSEAVSILAKKVKNPVGIFIKIDVGYHRTGILPSDHEEVEKIIEVVKKNCHFSFKGFMTHSGHSYAVRSREEICQIHNHSVKILNELRDIFMREEMSIISVGDTPICSILDDFSGVDEIRPGNFVFYDLIQNQIGSCDKSQIAVCMIVPVVAKHNDRNEVIVYGGGVHFSTEFFIKNGIKSYGEVVTVEGKSWGFPLSDCYVSKLSQEHGTIKGSDEFLKKTKVGDWIAILPVHSCMTSNEMGQYTTLDNERIDHMNGRSFKFL